MPTRDGGLTIADLRQERFQSAAEFGLDTISTVLQNDLDNYNMVLEEMIGDLAETTADRQRIYGTSAEGDMERADEYDRGVDLKTITGSTVGFPLYRFTRNLGWTYEYFLQVTPAELADRQLAVQAAHTRTMQREVKRAIFLSSNYTMRDEIVVPRIDLAVKRFVNADSAEIPNGPNGETFAGASHTHYDYLDGANPTNAALLALVTDVIEHGHGGMVKLCINRAAETAVKALDDFTPYADPRLVYRNTDTPGEVLDISRIDNRAIGLFGAAEVWVKSWVPAGYVFCYDAADPNKPLVYRQHPVTAVRGLRLVANVPDHPLYADAYASYFGFGVWTRTNGAVLYYAGSASQYVDPTIT